MAGGERFELPTLWFEARYSNPTELTAGKKTEKVCLSNIMEFNQKLNKKLHNLNFFYPFVP